MPDGGGSLTGYFDSEKLIKMKVWIGISYGVSEDVYYFNNDKLIYVSQDENNFHVDTSGNFDYEKFDLQFKGNFYFDNNKLLIQTSIGHSRQENDGYNAAKQFLEDAANYKKIVLTKRKRTNRSQ